MNTPAGFTASNFETLQSHMNKFRVLLTKYEELASEVRSSEKEIRPAGSLGIYATDDPSDGNQSGRDIQVHHKVMEARGRF